MRSRAGIGLLVAVLALVIGASAQAGVGITYPQGPDPAVRQWPSWPDRTACLAGRGTPFDPITTFSGETAAEVGTGEPEAALRKFLAETLDTSIPQRFWRLATLSDTRAEFVSGRLEQDLFWLEFERGPAGWVQVGEKSECRPRTVREGVVARGWKLSWDTPSRESRFVRVNLHDTEGCNGGRRVNPIAETEFRQVGKRLLLTIWVPPLSPGPHTCEAVREPPLRVDLPGGRLGKRSLWDGSSYPPRLRQ